MRPRSLPWLAVPLVLFLLVSLVTPSAVLAQEAEPAASEPLFFGWETEPAMDYGGRTVVSLHTAASRGFGRLFRVERRPGVAPAWEFPLAAFFLLVQHEVDGHGARAREFDLAPSYGINWDFSAATGIARAPRTNEENALLAAGGTEADTVLAHRILLDSLRPEGTDGARLPLLLLTKLDLTRYISGTPDPEPGNDFVEQFEDGNDIAIYLVSRQAQRVGADPADVWERRYAVDFADPLLEDTWDDARLTALWNLLDPALVSAMVAYFRDHVLDGAPRVRTPALRSGNGLAFQIGTRGALGPQEVSRFLDLHTLTRWGIVTVYVRDLDASVDRTYGFGAGIHGLRWRNLHLGLTADTWEEPEAAERLYDGTGWNVTGEVETLIGPRWGLSAKLGAKSDGFFPGRPREEGVYGGLGLLVVW
ncbi:MAG TPA: hypothetical protein VHN15_01190 [Thermoanaerobaculia bacterium]|nr:hypothetical protein [Thermoanaerobaculia bacterium]